MGFDLAILQATPDMCRHAVFDILQVRDWHWERRPRSEVSFPTDYWPFKDTAQSQFCSILRHLHYITACKQGPGLQSKTPISSCSWQASTAYSWAFQLPKPASLLSFNECSHPYKRIQDWEGGLNCFWRPGKYFLAWDQSYKRISEARKSSPVWFGKSVCLLRLGKGKKCLSFT